MRTLKQIALRANELENEIGVGTGDVLNKLTQELGEFNDAVQKYRGIYCKNIVDIEVVEGELGDLFFNLISICMRLGINLDDLPHLAEQTLLKFEERKEQYKYNCTIDAQEEAPIYRDQCIKVGDTYLDHEPVINPNSNVDIVCRRCGKEIELHKVICKYVTLKKNG